MNIVAIPVTRDQLIPYLVEGRGESLQEALAIVSGLGRSDEKFGASTVLDLLTDRRGTQRMMQRQLERTLTDQQKAVLRTAAFYCG